VNDPDCRERFFLSVVRLAKCYLMHLLSNSIFRETFMFTSTYWWCDPITQICVDHDCLCEEIMYFTIKLKETSLEILVIYV